MIATRECRMQKQSPNVSRMPNANNPRMLSRMRFAGMAFFEYLPFFEFLLHHTQCVAPFYRLKFAQLSFSATKHFHCRAIQPAMTRRTTAGGGHSHYGEGAPDRTWRWMEDGRKCGGVANRRRKRCCRCRGRPGYWYKCAWCQCRFCPGCICHHWCGWQYHSLRDSADKQHDWWRDSW